MKKRCANPRAENYPKYGGRGITVCAAWLASYGTFRAWALSHGYDDSLQIDRINNDAGYAPENCRWVSPVWNANNTRQNVRVSAFGEDKTLSQWVRDPRCIVGYETLAYRIRSRWNPVDALTRPTRASRVSRSR